MPNFYNIIRAKKFSTAADAAIEIAPYDSATPNFRIDAGGKLNWSSGSATADTNLYRSAANVLKTDDSFDVASGQAYKVAGTDVLTSSTILSSSTAATIGSSTGTTTVNNGLVVKQVLETVTTDIENVLGISIGNIDVLTSSIYYNSATPSGDFTLAIRPSSSTTDLNSMMSVGQMLSVTAIISPANAKKLTAVNINGVSQAINWFGGATPSTGNITDLYSISVLKTAASTYKVFASQAKFA